MFLSSDHRAVGWWEVWGRMWRASSGRGGGSHLLWLSAVHTRWWRPCSQVRNNCCNFTDSGPTSWQYSPPKCLICFLMQQFPLNSTKRCRARVLTCWCSVADQTTNIWRAYAHVHEIMSLPLDWMTGVQSTCRNIGIFSGSSDLLS